MNELAEQYASQKVGSIFIYTHEAHPGEYYPHLTSMEQKFRHAADLRDKLGVSRPIYLDALDGTCHRACGSMPNMTWIFNRAGIPVYKADWSDQTSIGDAVAYFVGVSQRRKQKQILEPFLVERLDYHYKDRDAFHARLEVSGPKAVREFAAAFGTPRHDDE